MYMTNVQVLAVSNPKQTDTGRRADRRVIIVAPHFPPSNLASVHRSRLFAQHLPEFGWEPIIVTVHHRFYEEGLDWNLAKLVPEWLRVERVGAIPTRPLRIVGDISLRGFFPMLRRILRIIDREGADFLYITIPPFFAAPLGRIVHALRGIPFGIDYIDPWINASRGSDQRFSKAWLSRRLGDYLEPIAVRTASLITGVTDGSYEGVLQRNSLLRRGVVTATMPYGGEPADHAKARELALRPQIFQGERKFHVLYAGTMWDAAREPLERVFRAIAANRASFRDVRFFFVGTGFAPNDPKPQIQPLAEKYGIWGDIVVEHPRRIPYLDVLAHLEAADAVFIFGSTLPHYSPSKLYQGILSAKPILAVLHEESTACSIVEETRSGAVLRFGGADGLHTIEETFVQVFTEFRRFAEKFTPAQVKRDRLDSYSARAVARTLANALNVALRCHSQGLISNAVRSGE
jgi:hypothetical protein